MSKLFNSFEVLQVQELFKRVGSFWHSHTKNYRVPRQLVKIATKIKLFNQFENIFKNLIKQSDFSSKDIFVNFKDEDIEYTALQLFDENLIYDESQQSINITENTAFTTWIQDLLPSENRTFRLLSDENEAIVLGFDNPDVENEYFILNIENGNPLIGTITNDLSNYKFNTDFINVINASHDFTFKFVNGNLYLHDITAVNEDDYHIVFTYENTLAVSTAETIEVIEEIEPTTTWVNNFNTNPYMPIKIINSGGTFFLALIDSLPSKNNLAYPIFIENGILNIGEPVVYQTADTSAQRKPLFNFNTGNLYYYKLPKTDINPISIQSTEGKLIINQDFFVTSKHIFFVKSPIKLFPNRKYLVEHGRVNQKSVHEFPLRVVNTHDNDHHIITYARLYQNPKQFQLALASVGNLKILKFDQYLISYKLQTSTNTIIYNFEKEVIIVSYPHKILEVGKFYLKDYIIGEGVKIYASKEINDTWWRQIEWGAGFSLDPICNSKNLIIPNKDVVAFIHSISVNNMNQIRVHANVNLDGELKNKIEYWQNTADREDHLGFYLENILKLQDEGIKTIENFNIKNYENEFKQLIIKHEQDIELYGKANKELYDLDFAQLSITKTVNPIDLYFEAILGLKGIVIIVDIAQIKNLNNFTKFLTRELPFGTIPIIIYKESPVEEVYQIDKKIIESYSVSISTTWDAEETTNLNTINPSDFTTN